jgi:hypothetical protein
MSLPPTQLELAIIQELTRLHTGNYIYEHQALRIHERAVENARILRRLQLIEPKWIHDFCKAEGWHIHKDYSHWQITYPDVGRKTYKPYTCFTLKHKKKDATADRVWRAIKGIAKHDDMSMDAVIDKVMTYAPSAIERLASVAEGRTSS